MDSSARQENQQEDQLEEIFRQQDCEGVPELLQESFRLVVGDLIEETRKQINLKKKMIRNYNEPLIDEVRITISKWVEHNLKLCVYSRYTELMASQDKKPYSFPQFQIRGVLDRFSKIEQNKFKIGSKVSYHAYPDIVFIVTGITTTCHLNLQAGDKIIPNLNPFIGILLNT